MNHRILAVAVAMTLSCSHMLAEEAVEASTGEEVVPCDSSNPILHFSFDSIEGNVAKDESGNGSNGKLINITTEDGILGKAARFNGTNGWIDVPSTPKLAAPESMTVALFIKLYGEGTKNKSYWSILSRCNIGNGQNNPFHVYVGSDKSWTLGAEAGKGDIDTHMYFATNFKLRDELGMWNHIAMVFDAEKHCYRLHINGNKMVIKRTVADTWKLIRRNDKLRFGVRGFLPYGNYINAAMDDIKVWDRALSEEEIVALAGPICSAKK